MVLNQVLKEVPNMTMIAVQEIKRRGICAVDKALENGPVHLIKSNHPAYVIMSEQDYQEMLTDLAEARLAASEDDLASGRIRRGSAATLMAELRSAT
jgi:PHD/YefM family antitoxin component YafN of YafNO toxin-antitoxin module